MVVYALVSTEADEAIALFVRRENAERMLAESLAHEPDRRDVLSIEEIELPVTTS
jgi:hypothetical protein